MPTKTAKKQLQSPAERAARWERVAQRDIVLCCVAAYRRPDGPVPSVLRTWEHIRDADGTLAADATYFATLQMRALAAAAV